MTSVIEELLGRAGEFAAGREPQKLPAPPSQKVAILTCMDARVDVHKIFGLGEGEAHVLRNAGGVVTEDVARSLALSQRLLGTESVIVMHHTTCGMAGLDEAALLKQLKQETGATPSWAIGGFESPEESVRDDVTALRADPFLTHKDDIRGFVYDVETGVVTEVDCP